MALDIKQASLSIAEDTVKAVVKDIVRPFAEEYILKSENKIDDIILGFMSQLESAILAMADKIDNQEG